MALYRAVRGFILVNAVRGDEHGGHHGKTAVRRRDHVAHHVAVVVFAGPNVAAFTANHARNGVVDQRVEVFNADFFKLLFIFRVVNFLENILKAVVVGLRNRVFCRKPQVLLHAQRVIKAGACKALNALINIM